MLLGISGASGAVYGTRTGALLVAHGVSLHVLVTKTAWEILADEVADKPLPSGHAARGRWLARLMGVAPGSFRLQREDDFRIPYASGSNPPDAVIVAPCSMGTAGRIASGISSSVLERCADVALKEGKALILVPREMPLSAVHLSNLLALARAGAQILPACPAFYHRPGTAGQLVDFVVSRILSRVGIDAGIVPPWGAARGKERAR